MEQFVGMAPLVLVFALMYFLIIRPQSKKAKEHQMMLASLSKGDRILMNGGLIGSISSIGDSEIELEVAPKMFVTVSRAMVAMKIEKETKKSAVKKESQAVEAPKKKFWQA
jgi:preprotein translocase subunit YajC